MRVMDALAQKNIKLLFGNRWMILESGVFHVFEHRFRKVTDTEIYTGVDEEIAVKHLLEGSGIDVSPE